jgi:hypothetical protein
MHVVPPSKGAGPMRSKPDGVIDDDNDDVHATMNSTTEESFTF